METLLEASPHLDAERSPPPPGCRPARPASARRQPAARGMRTAPGIPKWDNSARDVSAQPSPQKLLSR